MAIELFRNESLEDYEGPVPVDPSSHQHRLAIINPEAVPLLQRLGMLDGAEADELEITLNLFEDVRFDFVAANKRSTNAYSVLRGSVRGDTESRVVMTIRNSMLAIDIWIDDKEFQVVTLGNDLYLIEQVNLEAGPECSSDEHADTEEENNVDSDDDTDEEPPGNVKVGVLVIYESDVVAATSRDGDEQVLLSHIDLMVENLNTALSVSLEGTGVSVVMELLGPIKHDFPDMTNNCAATDALMNSSDVKQWRRDYGADLVSILRTGNGTSCADTLSNINGSANAAYSAVDYSQARQKHSFAHEIGHNFGCPHNKADADLDGVNANRDGIYWGYNWVHSNGKRYRTLMSYGGGTRILHFSNPNVMYRGEPTGSAKANNAAAIARTARAISQYRQLNETLG